MVVPASDPVFTRDAAHESASMKHTLARLSGIDELPRGALERSLAPHDASKTTARSRPEPLRTTRARRPARAARAVREERAPEAARAGEPRIAPELGEHGSESQAEPERRHETTEQLGQAQAERRGSEHGAERKQTVNGAPARLGGQREREACQKSHAERDAAPAHALTATEANELARVAIAQWVVREAMKRMRAPREPIDGARRVTPEPWRREASGLGERGERRGGHGGAVGVSGGRARG